MICLNISPLSNHLFDIRLPFHTFGLPPSFSCFLCTNGCGQIGRLSEEDSGRDQIQLSIVYKQMDHHNSATAIQGRDLELGEERDRQYRKTNSYTQRASFEQVLTIILFVVITALFSTFVTSAAVAIGFEILWILVGLTYALLLLIFYDYCFVTCSDPVDDLVLKIKREHQEGDLLFCRDCNSQVHSKSHHCRKCNRCSEHFDHHCKYLNNCIGGKNYQPFLRMLLSVTAYCLAIIGESAWVFTADSQDPQLSTLSRWGALATLILTAIALVAVDSLLCFHFYLIFWLKCTTLEYIRSLPDSEEERRPG